MFSHQVDHEIELRLLQVHHAEVLFAAVDRNRLYLRQWLPWVDSTHSSADTKAFIQRSLHQFATNGCFTCGIWYRNELRGSIGLHEIDWDNRRSSIGYWLDATAYGRGIMTKACRSVIDYAFFELKLNRIEIRCAIENYKSRAIPERLGFKQEGILRQNFWVYDHFVDPVVYGMLASEWQKISDFGLAEEQK